MPASRHARAARKTDDESLKTRAPSLDDAANRIAAPSAAILPDAAKRGAYDDAYGRYRRLFESLKPMFNSARS